MSKKTVLIIGFALIIMGGFVYFILTPSRSYLATEKLGLCQNVTDVKALWDENKVDLYQDETFLTEIRTKLISFDLSDEEEKACLTWLPQPAKNLNLIVIPDLSERLVAEEPGGSQTERDRDILKCIRDAFIEYAWLKPHSKDQYIVTLADKKQANGKFYELADNLNTDLSLEKEKINRDFFNSYQQNKYNSNLKKLYDYGQNNPVQADFQTFFTQRLADYLKESSLFDSYVNKVIILTDQDLNLQEIGDFSNDSSQQVLDLSQTDILICELYDKTGKLVNNLQLSKNWKTFLKQFNVKSFVPISRDFGLQQTCQSLTDFILK